MPHVVVEYSANLEARAHIEELVRRAHAAVLECGVFEVAAVRTRAERRDVYAIADGDPANMFINATVRMGPGRDGETRRRVGQALLDAVWMIAGPIAQEAPLAVSVEVQEIDDTAAFRRNNLHERLKSAGQREPAA